MQNTVNKWISYINDKQFLEIRCMLLLLTLLHKIVFNQCKTFLLITKALFGTCLKGHFLPFSVVVVTRLFLYSRGPILQKIPKLELALDGPDNAVNFSTRIPTAF